MTPPHSRNAIISYGDIFRLAWPASVAASVTPLLGAIDVWALAHSTRPLDIAAVGLASVIFSLAYWSFGFLRMSVAGLTAQAAGAEDEPEARASLIRGTVIGGAIGLALVLFQAPMGAVSFKLLAVGSAASTEIFSTGHEYFAIRIWGAPFVLASYAAFGWLSARGRTDYLMMASLFITGLNIALDYWFVIELGWGAAGVAAGTVIAEIAGFFACLFFVLQVMKSHGGIAHHWHPEHFFDRDRLARTLSVNRDIFIRTVLLAFSFAWFVQRGGAFGDVTLAANQVLLQLFLFTGLALDGTAIAAETLVGGALGMRDRERGLTRYRSTVRRTFNLAIGASVLFSLGYWLGGDWLIALLTPNGSIREATQTYMPWVVISPLMVVIGFQLDGIFIGATRAKEMRDSMIISTLIFIPASLLLTKQFGNHGLWVAFSLYFLLRGITLFRYLPRIQKSFEAKSISG